MPRRVYSAAPCFGRAQRWAGVDGLPPARWTGVGVERRGEAAFAKLVTGWQRSARAAATALSTTDGRWAFVSTSVTALVAGSIAWLAAGIMPPSSQQMSGGNDRSLMPYQLFMRLAAAHAHSAGGMGIDRKSTRLKSSHIPLSR